MPATIYDGMGQVSSPEDAALRYRINRGGTISGRGREQSPPPSRRTMRFESTGLSPYVQQPFTNTENTSRLVDFAPTKPGYDSSLAIALDRGEKQPPPAGRMLGIDTQEARDDELYGKKVRVSGFTDMGSDLPKTLGAVKEAIDGLQEEGIVSRKQAQAIADRGREDYTEALALIVNIMTQKAASPGDVQKIMEGKKLVDDDGEEGKEHVPLRFPVARYKETLPDLVTVNIMYKGVPSEIITKATWRAARDDISKYILSLHGLVINESTGNTVGMSTMSRLLSQSLDPFLLDMRNQRIIRASDLKKPFAALNKIQQLGEDRLERVANRPLVDNAQDQLSDLRDAKARSDEIDQDFADFQREASIPLPPL